jgi:hypothetical protein
MLDILLEERTSFKYNGGYSLRYQEEPVMFIQVV